MIICPLSSDECSKRIVLRPATVFLMTPAESKRDDSLKSVISRLSSELKRQGLSPLDGCSLVGLGDTVCKICSTMQGCAMGIGFYHPEMPADSLSNIFWEMGMMQGWGRPWLLVANKKEDLPSDFSRGFCIFYESNHQYIGKFKELIQSLKEREKYYIDTLASEAIQSADYEKAIEYYKEAFLISGNRQIISKLRNLKYIINEKHISQDLKRRLISSIDLANLSSTAKKRVPKTSS